MTARRRRKSGSGPSATALIAWVGGTRTRGDAPDATTDTRTSVSVVGSAPGDRPVGGRAILLGRACGIAAGTLLACGSVLVGATHVGDGSFTSDSAPLLNPTPDTSGGAAGAPVEVGADAPADSAPAAPDPVSAQAVTEPRPVVASRPGRVRRNTPVSVDMPAEMSQHPAIAPRPSNSSPAARDRAPAASDAPINPVLDPATKEVGRVAPVGGVLTPANPSTRGADNQFATLGNQQVDERAKAEPLAAVDTVNKVVAPLDNTIHPAVQPVLEPVTKQPLLQPAAQPAMAMLSSLLPIG
jgi:hypothetical protein